MRVEICRDDSGWTWIMPQLNSEILDKYCLGTFDLADWTFGTRESFEHATWEEDYRLPFYAKPFWFIENIFRFLEWYLFLNIGETMLYKLISKIRSGLFKIAWEISERGYYKEADGE